MQAVGLCSSCSHDTVFYLHTFNHFFLSNCLNLSKYL